MQRYGKYLTIRYFRPSFCINLCFPHAYLHTESIIICLDSPYFYGRYQLLGFCFSNTAGKFLEPNS